LPPRSRLWMSSSGGPTRRWRRRPLDLKGSVAAAASTLTDEASILNLVASSDGYGVRAHISEALQSRQPAARVIEYDLRGYRGHKPDWIADRICRLLTAAEIFRMPADRGPASLPVREVLKTHPRGMRLVAACRSQNRQSQGFCQCPG
jgi:hypothetical protein